MTRFNQKTLDSIKSDPELFAKVCEVMQVKPTSLPMIIDRNGNNLNQYSVVILIAGYLGKKPESLLEEVDEKKLTA